MTILQEAAEASSVWVTTQTVDEAELVRRVLAVLRPRDPDSVRTLSAPAEIVREIVPTGVPDHVAGWIGAGHLHERMLDLSPPPDFVFCLDPWAAMLIGSSRALLPNAKWTYVADVPRREEEREYWEDTSKWIGQLGFDQILPVEALAAPTPTRDVRKRPGAWEWRSLDSAAVGTSIAVRFSGSILRLRVFVDAVLRQEGTTSLHIVEAEPSAELNDFVHTLRLARPALKVELTPAAPPAVLDDGLILPADFQRRLRGRRCRLHPEVSAHILLGNLDPLPVYADLLRAHEGAPDDLLVLA